jgi:hypothetical protein
MKTKILAAIFCLVLPLPAFAGWVGPKVVVSGTWGKGPGQFGLLKGDSGDSFPRTFGISSNGKVAIGDSVNNKIIIFNNNGSFSCQVSNPTKNRLWPYKLITGFSGCAVVGYVEFTHTFNMKDCSLIGTAFNMGGASFVSDDCSKIYVDGEAGEKTYTPTGQLLQTYPSRPTELVTWEDKPFKSEHGSWQQRIVKFPDFTYPDQITTWVFKYAYIMTSDGYINEGSKVYSNYFRDSKGNIYGYNGRNGGGGWVARFNDKGKEIANLELPEDKIKRTPRPDDPGWGEDIDIIAEYGPPILDIHGNVYCWMRSKTHYKILKWTWKD